MTKLQVWVVEVWCPDDLEELMLFSNEDAARQYEEHICRKGDGLQQVYVFPQSVEEEWNDPCPRR
jgi:hypothetical protein